MGKIGANKMVCIADYVSPQKAAQIIGCTKGRVYQLLREGNDGPFRDLLLVGKRSVLISRREAEKVAKTPSETGRPRKKIAS